MSCIWLSVSSLLSIAITTNKVTASPTSLKFCSYFTVVYYEKCSGFDPMTIYGLGV